MTAEGEVNVAYDDDSSSNDDDKIPTEYFPPEDKINSDRPTVISTSVEGQEQIRTASKGRIWKNVVSISASFMCLFTAFSVTSSLQSSLNSVAGLGTTSQAAVYVGQILSSMFIPTLMINKLGLKWTMVLSELCYSTYIAVQFYPTFYTLIPAGFLVGIAAAPLWTAQSTYMAKAGNGYATLSGGQEQAEAAISRFFGVFFMIFQSASIWGNLISSSVLARNSTDVPNATDIISDDRLDQCGANFCFEEWNNFTSRVMVSTTSAPIIPPLSQIQMLFGILLGFSVIASIVIVILVDSDIRSSSEHQMSNASSNERPRSGWEMLIATFRHMKNPYQILIIPLTMWSGFGQTFIAAEFTAAFIVCAWGVENIGYVMLCHGSAGAIGSILFGYLVKLIGRIPLFLFGAAVNFTLILVMSFFWRPDPSHLEIFFIVAALWGLANSVWNTQINSFYGVIFNDHKEAAFSNFRLWQSLGFAIAYAYSTFLCTDAKLYICLAVLLTGLAGYLTIEIMERIRSTRLAAQPPTLTS